MSKDYVVRLFFTNGKSEQVKYETEAKAKQAYKEVFNAIHEGGVKIGTLELSDGTLFAFRVDNVSHWKYFKYTKASMNHDSPGD